MTDPLGNPVFTDSSLNDARGGDPGRTVLGPGTWTFEVKAITGSTGPYAFRVNTVADVSTLVGPLQPTDVAVDHAGQVLDYLYTAPDGIGVVFDLLVSHPFGRWSLIDPVGQPVVVDQAANDVTVDLSATLAPGDYTVRFDPLYSDLPVNQFEILEIDPNAPRFYYTRFAGAPNVKKAYYDWSGTTFSPRAKVPISTTPAADGLLITPDGDLLVGGGGAYYKVDADDGSYITGVAPPGTAVYHLALDPSGTRAWSSNIPGSLVEIPLVPFGDGIVHPLNGDDLTVSQLIFDRAGRAWYTTAAAAGFGNVGRIDLTTDTTTRIFSNLAGAHGAAYDPFHDTILVFGSNHVTQIDPDTATLIGDYIAPVGVQFDQGSTDGAGRAFVADNNGKLLVLDFSVSGLVDDPTNPVYLEHFEANFDDVAPMSWLGSHCTGQPPVVGLSPASGSVFPAGTQVVISGRVPAVDPTRPVVSVLVDGAPADAVDVAGNFFAVRTLSQGANSFHIEVVDRCGQADVWLDLTAGLDPASQPSADDAVTALIDAVWTDTTWSTDRTQLLVDLSAENTSGHPVLGPILMAVGPTLDPNIALVTPTGQTREGWDYVEVVPAGEVLDPGEISAAISIAFGDPDELPVRFSPIWLAPGNSPPRFTSTPITRAVQDQLWRYRPVAIDPDGHPLTWSVGAGPPGIAMNPGSGELTWTPTAADLGVYEVRIRVSDGHGGTAEQVFVLAVDPGATNTPPLIVTAPPPHLSVGAALSYDADAIDIDGDVLTWFLDAGPPGMALNPGSGLLSWGLGMPGLHPIEIRVEDGAGGSTTQAWSLAVGEVSANPNAPLITTSPPLEAAVANLFLYQPLASDPDGDALVWTLDQGPAGMTINPGTGRLLWTPLETDLGPHPVALSVTDGASSVRQSWQLTVTDGLANRAPVFTSVPGATAVVGVPWIYDADAQDPEIAPLVYDLPTAPASMAVDAATGILNWTPQPGEVGRQTVAVRATDPVGATASQFFFVDVRATNADPVVTSSAPGSVYLGEIFQHDVNGFDLDGDVLSYALALAPDGMVISKNTGLVTWLTTSVDLGSHLVTVRIRDAFGGTVDDDWVVDVIADTAPPLVAIRPGGDPACLDAPVQVCVGASDDTGVLGLVLLADGAGQTLDTIGCATVVPDSIGLLSLDASASDASGNVGTANQGLLVVDCEDPELPTLSVRSPAPGDVLYVPTEIVATIDDNTPVTLTWTVLISPHDADDWTQIASGAGQVSDATVATVDTTLLPNGDYDLRIHAEDGANVNEATWTVGVGGEYKVGHFSIRFNDLDFAIGGIPLSVNRTYNSLYTDTQSDFGAGWTFDLSGAVWDTEREDITGGLLGDLGAIPYTNNTRVYVVKPSGDRVGFTFEPTSRGGFALFQYTPAFTPDPGVTDTLQAVNAAEIVWNYGSGYLNYIIPYNPSTFRLTTREGLIYELDEALGLTRIEDPSGNTITVTPDAIVHSAGPQLTIDRDPAGRITRIWEPDENPGDGIDPAYLEYSYDADGNLASSSNQLFDTTTYRYDDPALRNYLTEIDDPTGRQMVRTVYDTDGRVIAQCPDDGDILTLDGCLQTVYDVSGGLTTTLDARGWQTDYFFDSEGNVTLERHWVEAAQVEEFAYTWDANHNLESTDQGGELTTATWDDRSRLLTYSEPGGHVWRFEYDAACGRRETQTSPTGDTWSWTYDAQCHPLTETDPLGHTTVWTNGNFGPTTRTDAVGNTWTWAYDGGGRIRSLTDPRGLTSTWTWADGNLASQTDRNGRRIDFTWDAADRLDLETWDNGRVVDWSWAGDDRLATVSDPDHTLSLAYGPTGQVAQVDYAGTPGAPQLRLDYTYDGASRIDRLTDGLGGVTDYDHDAMRRLSAITQTGAGVAPKRIAIDYDAVQRPTAVHRFADAAGALPVVRTDIGYDAIQPLLPSAIHHRRASDDAVIHDIDVVRDALGNVVQISDAEGAHSYLVDGKRRLLAATHPGGLQPDESYTLDAVGNRLTSHLSATHSYGYQLGTGESRLEQDDGFTYSWDNEGQLLAKTDRATNASVELDWDHRGRLTEQRERDGAGALQRTVRYTYDALDRRIAIDDDGAVTWVLHDGPNPVLEADSAGVVTVRRLYGTVVDRIYAEQIGGLTEWLLTDQIGTVRDRVNDSAVVVDHAVYDSFGRQLAGAGTGLGFQSRPSDPGTGLVFERARIYDPASGRFIERDPLLPHGYGFAENAPLVYADPTGQSVAIEYACLAISAVGHAKSAAGVAIPVVDILLDVNAGLNGLVPEGGTHGLGGGIQGMLAGQMGPFIGPIAGPPPPGGPGVRDFAEVWAGLICGIEPGKIAD